jgi:hypothetical protein
MLSFQRVIAAFDFHPLTIINLLGCYIGELSNNSTIFITHTCTQPVFGKIVAAVQILYISFSIGFGKLAEHLES